MKISLTRAQMIQAIVILIAVVFVLSTLGTWFTHQPVNGGQTSQATNLSEDELDASIGMGNVVLVVRSYSPVIRLASPGIAAKAYLKQLQAGNTILYLDESNPQYITITLSSGEDTLEVASKLVSLDKNATMLLEAYVSSDQEFEFLLQNGTKVKAKIPLSKISVSRPYKKGEQLYFSALVQLYKGQVIGAKLTPLARTEKVDLPVLPLNCFSEHYARFYFMWHDREGVRSSLSRLNESLKSINATAVQMQYVSDTTVYATDGFSKAQVQEIRKRLPGLYVVQFNKLVFYDNYTYTEDEISKVIADVTNNTVNVSFSPPMLEMRFNYAGNETLLENTLNAIGYTTISKEIYKVCNASTGDITISIGGKMYRVRDMHVLALLPTSAKPGAPEVGSFEAYIVGDEIVRAEPVLETKYK
ncbi:MAG: hypothetical protein N3G76_00670 [Candidatus Micrarchaeota archaeon]|nr:hypothetical protein [Candidatus Micrarchaeota archaeon]